MNVMAVIVMTMATTTPDSEDDAWIDLAFLDSAGWIDYYLV